MQYADNISQITEPVPGGRAKTDLFKGEHFNIVAISLDSGAEIPPHEESYDVFFYVVSGKGVFTVGGSSRRGETGGFNVSSG